MRPSYDKLLLVIQQLLIKHHRLGISLQPRTSRELPWAAPFLIKPQGLVTCESGLP